MSFTEGEEVWALNLKYKDGTRLRSFPRDDSDFNGVWVGNDTNVRVIRSENDYVLVQKSDDTTGWIRVRNLTREPRTSGITKGVVSNQIVTPDPEYVMGTKIYGVGIKQDPIPGEKMGKGIQHLTSAYWVSDMAQLIGSNFVTMQEFLRHAKRGSDQYPGYDYLYLINLANYLFNKADVAGLKNQESKDHFLMATWLVMAAAEVDKFPFGKYSAAEREEQRQQFYDLYLNPKPGPGVVQVPREDATLLGKFAAPICRVDLIPMIAMDRLGINNELSALKYKDAEAPLRDGFPISKRTDSLKRHFEAVHRGLQDEDHVIHLLWNFMAIYHVNHVYPNKNDLVNFENIRLQSESKPLQSYSPATSLQKIISNRYEPSQVLKLDWNEGVIPPPISVRTAMVEFIAKADGHFLKWYPNLGGGEELRAKLAEYTESIPENIMVTNGSDDALILICQTFLSEGKVAVAPMPTYEHFCVNAENTGATLIRLDLADFLHSDPDEIATAVEKHHPSVVYLISPNNPTGAHWDIPAVSNLAKRYPEVIFICDEAYHEFARINPQTGKPITCVSLVKDLPNVIITRTFSKAFCLAALRVGYIVAHPNTVEKLRIRYNPKSVNSLAQVAAHQALVEFESYYKPYITITNNARDNFVLDLQERGFNVKSGGGGNFVCIAVPHAKISQVTKKLEENNIFVRDISARVPGFIRVSIGEDMTRVRDTLFTIADELALL